MAGLDLPGRLVLVLALSLGLWSLLFAWLWRRRGPERGRVFLLTAWLLPWGLFAALFLAGLYRWDRAGRLWEAVTGYDSVWAEDLGADRSLSLAEFLARHPAFRADPQTPGRLRLPAGRHDFDETIVLPDGLGLLIEPGAELRFGPGRSLVAYGPIEARGRAEQPIVFAPRRPGSTWGGVAVLDAEGPSVFEEVRFRDARRAHVNGVDLVAGLSLHRSDARILRSRFENMYGKDAINVVDAELRMEESLVRGAKDGLDMDDGRGQVVGNQFLDCRDEGIDLSGATVAEIRGNAVLDRRGGRVAAEKGLAELVRANRLGWSEPP